MRDYREEAIDERNPAYELPGDGESDSDACMTLSGADALRWREMVRLRPMLRIFRQPNLTLPQE